VIESYTITHMAHGTPLATGAAGAGGGADDACGAAGPFLLEAGISSSYHIARFFGLAADVRDVKPVKSERVTLAPAQPGGQGGRGEPAPAPGEVLDGEVLDPEPDAKPGHGHVPPLPIDIGAVITKALTAAGLMKGR
jgi:hypothetical protein